MTQTEMVLVYMARHGSITQYQANELGIGRLAARIADLKRRGHIINSEMINVRKANGTTAKVACYSIGGEDGRE